MTCRMFDTKPSFIPILIHFLNAARSFHSNNSENHDDVIKWKHFPRNWPFVREIHRSPVNSPHKGQWRRALMFSLTCARINGWVNNGESGDLRRYRAHYDVIVMHFHAMTSPCVLKLCRYLQIENVQPETSSVARCFFCRNETPSGLRKCTYHKRLWSTAEKFWNNAYHIFLASELFI